jgi:hypothetical protein
MIEWYIRSAVHDSHGNASDEAKQHDKGKQSKGTTLCPFDLSLPHDVHQLLAFIFGF